MDRCRPDCGRTESRGTALKGRPPPLRGCAAQVDALSAAHLSHAGAPHLHTGTVCDYALAGPEAGDAPDAGRADMAVRVPYTLHARWPIAPGPSRTTSGQPNFELLWES